MDKATTKISFNIDDDLHQEVKALMRQTPKRDQTVVLNQLIADGLNAAKELERVRRREDYLLMKMLFTLRFLAGSRGPGTLEEIDRNFAAEIENIREMIFSEGMDYGG